MKKGFVLIICMIISTLFYGQNYSASTGQQCGAYVNKEGTFVDAPYVTQNVILSMDWLYCGPWNGSNNGHIYVDIWIDGSWQDLFDLTNSNNGCSWVNSTWSISAATWNSAIDSNGGSVKIRGYITDSCSPGVGCSSYNDPCFNGFVDFDYEPLVAPVSLFEITQPAFCVDQNISIVDLSEGSALDYSWNFGTDASPASSGIGGEQVVSYSSPGTKTVELTVSNLLGDSTYSFEIDVNPVPELSTTEDIIACANTFPINIEAMGTGDLLWSDDLGSESLVEISPEASTTYYVSLINEFSCSASDSVVVNVLEVPFVEAGVDTAVCFGYELFLMGSSNEEAVWLHDPEAGITAYVSPELTTSYYLYAEGANGCSSTDSVTIYINELPEADAGEDLSICIGDTIIVEASGGTLYNWDNGLGEGSTHEVIPEETISYIVLVGNEMGCFSSDTLDIIVNDLPTLDVTEGGDLCPGESIVISASGGGEYLWDNGLGSESSYEVSPAETTTYTVTVTNEFDCSTAAEISVVVHPFVEVSLSGIDEDPYCSVDLNAYNLLGSPSGGTFSGNGVVGNQFLPSEAGIGILEITYTYTDEFSCEYSSTVFAEVEICASVEEWRKDIEIYPNPVQSELTIGWDPSRGQPQIIRIYDVNGKLIQSNLVSNDSSSIILDLSTMESANYILEMKTDISVLRWNIMKE